MKRNPSAPVISSGVYSWLLDYEMLLFSEHAGALFRLNQSAALIWSCLEEGMDRDAIVLELAEAFGVSASRADRDVETALQEWRRLELLGRRQATARAAAEQTDAASEPGELPQPSTPAGDYPAFRCYRMLKTVIRVRFSDPALCRVADSVFGHLRVTDDQPFELALDVHRDPHGYYLYRNGQPHAWCETEQEVAPLLHGEAVSEAYANADCLIAIHAAAVSDGSGCIVFPATSGSGKTTLTAALIGAGFRYATDELVLLQHRSHEVQAIAAGLGIKAGSWPVLESFHPVLDQLPTGLRQDGQAVRYLLPPDAVMPEDHAQSYQVRALVFPSYQADVITALDPVSSADALCRLTDAGTDMAGGLELSRVTELVNWIRGVRCYELRYGDLREAVSRLAELLK